MKIVKPSAELWIPENHVQHVARCARVCYGKASGDDERLYNALKASRHNSMFRHETRYYIMPSTLLFDWKSDVTYNIAIGCVARCCDDKCFIAANGNYLIDHDDYIKKYEVSLDEFSKYDCVKDLIRYTFCLTTQISTSRELNRVSPNSIAERSTRYVDESNGAICQPYWVTDEVVQAYKEESVLDARNQPGVAYLDSCARSFDDYRRLLSSGIPKEYARGVLPLDTATKVVYTYSAVEWKHIIDLRYHGTTGRPHSNAKEVIGLVRDKLNEFGYDY